MKVFKVRDSAKLPQKADGDMCYDVFADIDEILVIPPLTAVKIPTGLVIDPYPYHISLRSRSGLALGYGFSVIGGQIDMSYRGEILVIGIALKEMRIFPGDKIAQFKLEPDISVEIKEVSSLSDLDETQRGSNGFGSTGR